MPRILEERARRHADSAGTIADTLSAEPEDADLVACAIHHLGATIALAADELTRLLAMGVPYPAGRPQSMDDAIWRILHRQPGKVEEAPVSTAVPMPVVRTTSLPGADKTDPRRPMTVTVEWRAPDGEDCAVSEHCLGPEQAEHVARVFRKMVRAVRELPEESARALLLVGLEIAPPPETAPVLMPDEPEV